MQLGAFICPHSAITAMCWRFADPRDPTDFDKTRLNRPNEKDTSVPKSNAMNSNSSSATKRNDLTSIG
jgi:hypothetical protein